MLANRDRDLVWLVYRLMQPLRHDFYVQVITRRCATRVATFVTKELCQSSADDADLPLD